MAVEGTLENRSNVSFRRNSTRIYIAGMFMMLGAMCDLAFFKGNPYEQARNEIPYPISDPEVRGAKSYKSFLDSQILEAAYLKDYGKITLIVEDPKTASTTFILDQLKTADEQRSLRVREINASQEIVLGNSRIPRSDFAFGAAGLGAFLSVGGLLKGALRKPV